MRVRLSSLAIATVGTAWSSVHSLSRASAILRVETPMATTATTRMKPEIAARPSPRRDSTGGVGSGCGASSDMRFSDRGGGRLGLAPMGQAENDRHEHERCNGSENQAANN